MYNRSRVLVVALVLSMFIVALFPRPTRAQFVLASWEFPDEYGQGIEEYALYENSTGSWVQIESKYVTNRFRYNDTETHDWDSGVGIKLAVYSWINETLTGIATGDEGKLYQQHSILVTSAGITVFSQQNFTYSYFDDGIHPDRWLYVYTVIFNFLPQAGAIYTTTVTYEIYW